MRVRLTRNERALLELAADREFEGRLADWPVLRGLLFRCGAPDNPNLVGPALGDQARAVLVELGFRRAETPLSSMSLDTFKRTFLRRS